MQSRFCIRFLTYVQKKWIGFLYNIYRPEFVEKYAISHVQVA